MDAIWMDLTDVTDADVSNLTWEITAERRRIGKFIDGGCNGGCDSDGCAGGNGRDCGNVSGYHNVSVLTTPCHDR